MATAPDFLAACVAALQADSVCATAFGSTSQTPRFFGVYATRTTASPSTVLPTTSTGYQLPFARLLEVGESDTFQSGYSGGVISYFARGILQVDVFDTSPTGARTKGKLVARVLNDANLTFDDGGLLELRQTSKRFVPEPDSAPGGTAVVYHQVIEFLYCVQYAL